MRKSDELEEGIANVSGGKLDTGTVLTVAEIGAGFVPGKILGPFAQGGMRLINGMWTARKQQQALDELADSAGISPEDLEAWSSNFGGAQASLDNSLAENGTRFGGAAAGGAAGGWAGAGTGAFIGSAVGPVGTAVGGFVGGLAGGIAGGEAGDRLAGIPFKGQQHYDVVNTTLAIARMQEKGQQGVDEFTVFQLALSTVSEAERAEFTRALEGIRVGKDGTISQADRARLLDDFSYLIEGKAQTLLGDAYTGTDNLARLTAAINEGKVHASRLIISDRHLVNLPAAPRHISRADADDTALCNTAGCDDIDDGESVSPSFDGRNPPTSTSSGSGGRRRPVRT